MGTKLQRLKAKAAASQHYGSSYRSKSGNSASSVSGSGNIGSGGGDPSFGIQGVTNYQRGGGAEERNFAATSALAAAAAAAAATDAIEKSYQYSNNNINHNYQKSNYTSANYNTNNNNYNNNHPQPTASATILPYQPHLSSSSSSQSNNNPTTMIMTKQKNTLAERLNIGEEVRELKLGATFNPKNTSTAFHTIKCKTCPPTFYLHY